MDRGGQCVGIALHPAKAKKHISPKLLEKAAEAGITIKIVDPYTSLEEQEPFDVLLHKIRNEEWHAKLKEYQKKQPELRVVDDFNSVMQLANRTSMLQPLQEGIVLRAPQVCAAQPSQDDSCDRKIWDRANSMDEQRQQQVHVGVPIQIVIKEGTSPEDAREAAGNAGFHAPYLGKPLWADGREGSHGLLVIHDKDGLQQLATGPRPSSPQLPIVLQQYVPHGALLFKVYVMGPITILARRPSLQLPVPQGDLQEEVGHIQSVGRVSAYYSESEFGSAPQGDPPHWAIQALAQDIRSRYNLTLFNFDLIQPDKSPQNGSACLGNPDFLLVDINAFPGFEKLPDYEDLMVLYLESLFSKEPEQHLTRFVAHSHVSPRDLTVAE